LNYKKVKKCFLEKFFLNKNHFIGSNKIILSKIAINIFSCGFKEVNKVKSFEVKPKPQPLLTFNF